MRFCLLRFSVNEMFVESLIPGNCESSQHGEDGNFGLALELALILGTLWRMASSTFHSRRPVGVERFNGFAFHG